MTETTPTPKPPVKRDATVGTLGAVLGAITSYFYATGQMPSMDCEAVDQKVWTEIRELREKQIEIKYAVKAIEQELQRGTD